MATLGTLTVTIKAIEEDRLEKLLEQAFYAGFDQSSESFNGTQDDAYWHELDGQPDMLPRLYASWREQQDV